MLNRLKLILLMPFVYPVIYFSSLHVLKSSYELKYALFQIWSRWILNRAQVKARIVHSELIPLENDYVFVFTQASSFNPLILASVLPVNTHFILSNDMKLPFINVYAKRLNVMRISKQNNFLDVEKIERDLSESSVCIFLENYDAHLGIQTFFKAAIDKHWTLIPVTIQNHQNILRKNGYHHVDVEIKTPIYFEEYEGKTAIELSSLMNERIHLL